MAKGKSQKQLRDEAFLRQQQTTIEDQIEPTPAKEWPKLDAIPAACPECNKPWRDDAGLVPIIRPRQHELVFLESAQCGGCGNLFLIDPADHERIRLARQAYTDAQRARNAPLPKPARGKRERGAG